MINFLNLEYFLVAAEELNFTRAARKLYISQQSLSNHISNLEKEFDVILFNRTLPLTLTYAGQALKARARELLDLRDETYREIADIKDFSTGQLSIGVSHTRGRVILPEILPSYQTQFPGIELKLIEGNSSALASELLHGNIDLMIDLLPFAVENVETVPVCAEEILLIAPDMVLEKAYPGRLEEIKAQLSQSAEKGQPGAHHRGRNVRGSPDHAPDCAGDGKYRDGTGPERQGHGDHLLPPHVHVQRPVHPGPPHQVYGAGPLESLPAELPARPRRSGNRLPQGPLHVPGHQGIHPHRQRADPLQSRLTALPLNWESFPVQGFFTFF